MHIVQLANFYGPRSGGLRTALHHLGAGYVASGHEVTLVVPGTRYADEVLPTGVRRFSLPAPKIPGTGGYRAVDPHRVRAVLRRLEPDRLEVSDRLTLRGMGGWARRHGVPSTVISHERLDRLLEQFLLPEPVARRVADAANRRMAASYDTVVCTTAFARAEFDRIAAPNVRRVPLGVDLATFRPTMRDDGWRTDLAGGADALLVHCGRLSPEKHVERSVDTVAELTEAGARVRLVVAGDGPRRRALERRARGPAGDVPGVPVRPRRRRAAAGQRGRLPGARPPRDVRARGVGGAGVGDAGGGVGVVGAAGNRAPRLRRGGGRPRARVRHGGDEPPGQPGGGPARRGASEGGGVHLARGGGRDAGHVPLRSAD